MVCLVFVLKVAGVITTLLSGRVEAQDTWHGPGDLQIAHGSRGYEYAGCWPFLNGQLPLWRGVAVEPHGSQPLDVPACLSMCRDLPNKGVHYQLAALHVLTGGITGCSCAMDLAKGAKKTADSNCDVPCSGETNYACGGVQHITLYNLTHPETKVNDNNAGHRDSFAGQKGDVSAASLTTPIGLFGALLLAALTL